MSATNQNWWQRQHPAAKGFLILGGIGILIWGGYAIFGNKTEDKKLPNGSGGNTNNNDTGNTGTQTETSNNGAEAGQPPQSSLPDGGQNCGPVHTDFDFNFDYVKCNGIWYTLSKSNPKDAKYKGLYTTWQDIQKVASDPALALKRLDARYSS